MPKAKKIISLLLSVIMIMSVFTIVPFTAGAAEAEAAVTGAESGTTGDCTWSLDNGVLTISGNGKMEDYYAPWDSYDFNTVVIESGVTSIGDSAFSGCTELTSVTIPDSVKSIGTCAFVSCASLMSITIPASVTSINDYAIGYVKGLTPHGSGYIPVRGFTIYGYEGSAAKKYATDNGFNFAYLQSSGATVSGKITSSLSDTDSVSVLLMQDGKVKKNVNVKGNSAEYSFTDVKEGTYNLLVSKKNHINREYSVTVADTDVTQDVTLCPKGDVNADGKTNAQDCTAILRYVRKIDTGLSDYQLKCADVTGDGKTNVQDVTRILRHVRKIEALY